MLLPIGYAASLIDDVFLADIEEFGRKRGEAAHMSTLAHVQQGIDPKDECEPPDFGAVLYALELVEPGDVSVIAASGHVETAMIGEILGGSSAPPGRGGPVCDGAICDVATRPAGATCRCSRGASRYAGRHRPSVGP